MEGRVAAEQDICHHAWRRSTPARGSTRAGGGWSARADGFFWWLLVGSREAQREATHDRRAPCRLTRVAHTDGPQVALLAVALHSEDLGCDVRGRAADRAHRHVLIRIELDVRTRQGGRACSVVRRGAPDAAVKCLTLRRGGASARCRKQMAYLGEAEISNDHLVRVCAHQQQVLGLEVAVHDAVGVQVINGREQACHRASRLLLRKLRATHQPQRWG